LLAGNSTYFSMAKNRIWLKIFYTNRKNRKLKVKIMAMHNLAEPPQQIFVEAFNER